MRGNHSGQQCNLMPTLNRLPGLGKLAISAVKIVAAENVRINRPANSEPGLLDAIFSSEA
jgi:hypothetical protein